MRLRNPAAFALIALAAVVGVAQGATLVPTPSSSAALDSVVASERAFAALSVATSTREAFVTYLADDAIVFQPLPTLGKPLWEARTPRRSTLTWQPSTAEVSAAGDLGWTTGPWEFRPPPDSTGAPAPADQIAHGHFTSVWAVQADGSWRVALDLGISHPAQAQGGLGDVRFAARPQHRWARNVRRPVATRTQLATLEQRFATDAMRHGASALDTWGAQDLVLGHDGAPPAQGRSAARAAVKDQATLRRLAPQGERVAASDDLGYTYGMIERDAKGGAADTSVYVHIWRREPTGAWKIVSIVENPINR